MKISQIQIQNFRLLKDFSIDLEDDLSLIIGKNNTGKTSLLTALDKFIGSNDKKFTYNDFNLELREKIIGILDGELPDETAYTPLGIKTSIQIEYDDNDNLSEVSKLIMSLDPEDKTILIELTYELSYLNLRNLKKQYSEEKEAYEDSASFFLEDQLTAHIPAISSKSVSSDKTTWLDLQKEKIQLNKIIGFQYVSAKREVTNRDHDKTLSGQTSRIYKKTSESDEQKAAVDEFKLKLRSTDTVLTEVYTKIFKDVIKKINKFGGLKPNETQISIASTLQHRELLEDNTTVKYNQGAHELPEHYNGLGYMNLISMIFEIEVLINQLKKDTNEHPAPINLLFIEEPEAHTHPQMQYVFIKNIKSLLDESRNKANSPRLNLQTVISTHSSHIVAESDFDDIKYLKRVDSCSVEAKNLKSLQDKYDTDETQRNHYRFLKQYLTLNRAEVFFADKIIMIEGDTERILLPAMMKKIDQEQETTEDQETTEEQNALKERPLLSQNVSMIEVGAHSKTYEHFIDFLGVKTLIITDIDSGYIVELPRADKPPKKEHKKCPPNDANAQLTTNDSLIHFHGKERTDLEFFTSLNNTEKRLKKNGENWEQADDGHLYLTYQTEENGYHARSFEDSFFSLNKCLLTLEKIEAYPSITPKWYKKYASNEIGPFEFAENAVGSKPSLAIEILMNSVDDATGHEFSNWTTPNYIKEGLLWLQKD